MRQRILVAMCIAAGSTAIAYAQAQSAPAPGTVAMDGPDRAMRAPLTRADAEKKTADHFAAIDLNHDGAVTRDELAAAQRVERDKMRAFLHARMTERRDRTFDRLDANKDGSISRAEFAAATPPRPEGGGTPPPPGDGGPGWRGPMMGHAMAARGPNGREHGGPGGAGPMRHGPMLNEHWFEQADANHDNKVTLAEAKATALARFDRLDTNHDGTIQPEERRMAFRTMGHGGFGPPPGTGPANGG